MCKYLGTYTVVYVHAHMHVHVCRLCYQCISVCIHISHVTSIVRPTTVHRFYVNNTVEDKMYHLFHPDGEEGVPTERCVKHRTDCT